MYRVLRSSHWHGVKFNIMVLITINGTDTGTVPYRTDFYFPIFVVSPISYVRSYRKRQNKSEYFVAFRPIVWLGIRNKAFLSRNKNPQLIFTINQHWLTKKRILSSYKL